MGLTGMSLTPGGRREKNWQAARASDYVTLEKVLPRPTGLPSYCPQWPFTRQPPWAETARGSGPHLALSWTLGSSDGITAVDLKMGQLEVVK